MSSRRKVAQADPTPTYRVIRLPTSIREGIKRHRGKTNNETVIREMISRQLPALVKSLKTLGFAILVENGKSYRLPFGDDTLAQLRDASEQVGVPAAHLLTVSLARLSTNRMGRKRRRAGTEA